MIDTHCHLNFKAFAKTLDEVVIDAKNAGVTHIVVPGTDFDTSKKAVELAATFPNVYAAVGIHPHHAEGVKVQSSNFKVRIEELIQKNKVVAIGEVGLDRHVYERTKYENYRIDDDFINSQKDLLITQMQMAIKHNKSLILHNRETADELIALLTNCWDRKLEDRTVLHCCEPNDKLLTFTKTHHLFIGVDGDVTYNTKKQEFVKNVPPEMLVVETDAPYLLPEPLRSQKKYPNTPANIPYIVKMIAALQGESVQTIAGQTTANAKQLFNLTL